MTKKEKLVYVLFQPAKGEYLCQRRDAPPVDAMGAPRKIYK
jgi:hypothetical protein